MAVFTIEYTLTERTRRKVDVEADTMTEALAAVEEYEADLSDSWEVDSLEYSVADAKCTDVDDGDRTIETRYQICGTGANDGDLLTREELEARLTLLDKVGGDHLRPQLRGQPVADGMAGPTCGGWRDANGEYVFLENDYDPTSEPKSYSKHEGPIAFYVVRYDT